MDKYAVIGNPVSHSLSPQIHAAFAKQTQQSIEYTSIEAPLDGFIRTLHDFQAENGKGVNVTLPFKIQAFELADKHSKLAEQAGASNLLMFRDDGSIFADNSDGPGLIQDLTHNQDYCLRQKNILVLGAGGAAQGILAALISQAPAQIVIANRTAERAQMLAEKFKLQGSIQGIGLNALRESPFDLIINTTSAGFTGANLKLPHAIIGEQTHCYDLMYGSQGTPFLSWAKTLNATHCYDGLGLLVEQAALSFYLWRGIYPQTKTVIESLRQLTQNTSL
ncbi:MAG: shikimate dehydrogenase [Gammaproteobacteria bacterium]|nr:shikimate dehydrogenase [Gammaproteobacteria bacterium]